MTKKYVFVRMPEETYNRYKNIKLNMENDVKNFLGRDVNIPMTNVFKAIVSPEYNEKFIQIDLHKLSGLGIKRRRKL